MPFWQFRQVSNVKAAHAFCEIPLPEESACRASPSAANARTHSIRTAPTERCICLATSNDAKVSQSLRVSASGPFSAVDELQARQARLELSRMLWVLRQQRRLVRRPARLQIHRSAGQSRRKTWFVGKS